MIIEHGVCRDPTRIEGLSAMPVLMTTRQLQQFICATKWMRDCLVDYSRTIRPLQLLLDRALSRNRKTKRVTSGVAVSLGDEEINSFNQVKQLL